MELSKIVYKNSIWVPSIFRDKDYNDTIQMYLCSICHLILALRYLIAADNAVTERSNRRGQKKIKRQSQVGTVVCQMSFTSELID